MNLPNNDISYTWNHEFECPECDSILIVNQNNKHCVDMKCPKCDYTVYSDNFDILSEESNV